MNRQTQKAATARRIYAAAMRLFAEQGFDATTIEQITRAAGVAKGTFFTHFPSKDAVLDYIGRIQMDRVAATLAADPAFVAQPARVQFQTVLHTLAAGIIDQPAEMRALTIELLMRRSLFDIDQQNIGELDALLAQIGAAGQKRGELRADTTPLRIATLVRGAYFLGFFEWVQQDAADLLALVAHYLDLVLDGMTVDRRSK